MSPAKSTDSRHAIAAFKLSHAAQAQLRQTAHQRGQTVSEVIRMALVSAGAIPVEAA